MRVIGNVTHKMVSTSGTWFLNWLSHPWLWWHGNTSYWGHSWTKLWKMCRVLWRSLWPLLMWIRWSFIYNVSSCESHGDMRYFICLTSGFLFQVHLGSDKTECNPAVYSLFRKCVQWSRQQFHFLSSSCKIYFSCFINYVNKFIDKSLSWEANSFISLSIYFP